MTTQNVAYTLEKMFGFKNTINWIKAFSVIFYHIFGVYWCWKYMIPAKILTVAFACFMVFFNGIGITCGVHRLFTHRSYKVKPLLKWFLIVCYSSAGQNSIYQWVRDHRVHHKFSDTPADPHDANRGLFFSHIGWLMMNKNEEVKKQGRKIDMSDIRSDKLLMFQHKFMVPIKLVLCFILPTVINIYLWNENWRCAVAWQCFLRYLIVFHGELSVNSLAHAYGYKPYNKNIVPRENTLVARITFGEGWHNYHHVFPFDYKAAEYFDKINISGTLINWWAKKGWAYDLKEATPDMVNSVASRLGDFSKL